LAPALATCTQLAWMLTLVLIRVPAAARR
jgi:hypothetical protein